jgi:HAD superfamily hydrolase (TIGR01509 family)
MIEAVVFDVGETLVDETRIWEGWARHLGIPRLTLFATLGAFIADGRHHREPFSLFRPDIDVDLEIARYRAAGRETPVGLDDLYPDAIPTLRALAAMGFRLGVAANQPVETAASVRQLGIDLDLVGMSDEWGVAKPDPAFFSRIARELDLPPERIAYVGDRVDNDVRPARAAGMLAVFVRRGPWAWIQAGRDDPPEADLVLESLAELPAALRPARSPSG